MEKTLRECLGSNERENGGRELFLLFFSWGGGGGGGEHYGLRRQETKHREISRRYGNLGNGPWEQGEGTEE